LVTLFLFASPKQKEKSNIYLKNIYFIVRFLLFCCDAKKKKSAPQAEAGALYEGRRRNAVYRRGAREEPKHARDFLCLRKKSAGCIPFLYASRKRSATISVKKKKHAPLRSYRSEGLKPPLQTSLLRRRLRRRN